MRSNSFSSVSKKPVSIFMRKSGIMAFLCSFALLVIMIPNFSVFGMSTSDWESFGNPSSQDGEGVNLCAQHTYKTALNPDYIAFDMQIKNLDASVDASTQINIGFVNGTTRFDPNSASPSGIGFTIRNDWGNGLNVEVVKTGTPPTNIVSGQTLSDLTVGSGMITVKLQKQSDNSYVLSLGSHNIPLPGVTAADFTDSNGKTYLAVCVKPQPTSMDDVALRNFTIFPVNNTAPSVFSPADWESFGNPSSQDGEGVNLCAQHTYKTALSPEYIAFDMQVKNLDASVDASTQINIGFVNGTTRFDPSSASPSGIGVTIRNDWGNGLNVEVVKTGTPPTNIVSGQTLSDLTVGSGMITVKLQKQSDNSYVLSLGSHNIPLPGVTAADFTDSNGKTYLAVCVKPQPTSMDDVALRNFTIFPVSNTAPSSDDNGGTDPTPGDDNGGSVPTLEDGMVASSWNDFGGTCTNVTGGVQMYKDATYIPGLNPDYIEFDWTVNNMPGTVDTWIALGFMNHNDKSFFVLNNDPAGIGVMARNINGRFNVTVFTTDAFGTPIINERALSTAVPGKVKVQLEKQENGSYVLSFDSTKIALPGVTAADFTDTSGKTYLAFCAFNADGMEASAARKWTVGEISQTPGGEDDGGPAPTLEDGMVASSWNDFGGTCTNVTGGVQMYKDATYIPGLNPDYIEFDWTVNNMPGTVDTWIALGFVNRNDAGFYVESGDPAGIGVLMRNLNNSFNVTVFKTGSLGTPIVKERTIPIPNPGRVKVRLAKQDDGSYTLSFGSYSIPLTGITKTDFTDAGSKTYLSFCAYSAAGMDAADARKWTVGTVSQTPSNDDNASSDYYWMDPYNTVSQKDGYFTSFSDIAYTRPFEPGTISVDLQFEKLNPSVTADSWDAFVQLNLMPNSGVPGSDISGVSVVFRNLDGKLLVDIVGNGEGVSPQHTEYNSWTFFRKQLDINALNTRLSVVLKSNSDGNLWSIYINGIKITDTPLSIPRSYAVNSDGCTFLSLIARSQTGEAADMRFYRVYGVTADNTAFENQSGSDLHGSNNGGDVGNTGNVETGDSSNTKTTAVLLLLSVVIVSTLGVRRKKFAR